MDPPLPNWSYNKKKIDLLSDPENGTIVGAIEKEIGVKIKNKCSDWIEIQYDGIRGWVESKWLCGNPVTTCP